MSIVSTLHFANGAFPHHSAANARFDNLPQLRQSAFKRIQLNDDEDTCHCNMHYHDESTEINELIQKLIEPYSSGPHQDSSTTNHETSSEESENPALEAAAAVAMNHHDCMLNNYSPVNDALLSYNQYPITSTTNQNRIRNSDSVTKADLELEMIINQYGGESMNLPSMSGQFYSNQPPRQSRPSSSQSQSYGGYSRHLPSSGNPGSSGGGGGGGGGAAGGGSGDGGHSDSNRQIVMILLRLQQDTNNVLNRLSYLENTVATIQNNLQMNTSYPQPQTNVTSNGAYPLMNQQPMENYRRRRLSFWKNYFKNVDWTTVSFAIIWPIVIRLVFKFFRKVQLVIKLRRVRRF